MARFVVLDSAPLGDVGNARGKPTTERCRAWLDALLDDGTIVVVVPEIADYEVRRELSRSGATDGIARLDDLVNDVLYFAPITTEAMRVAAEFWALVRNQGRPTADPKELDGDAILAAQTSLIGGPDDEVLIATTNVGHLGRFPGIDARLWHTIG